MRRSIKSATMPEPNGPGRYKATNGIKSSKCSGLRSITSLVIPSDSSWNTPDVSPFVRISQAALSSSGIASKSRSIPRFALMSFKASPHNRQRYGGLRSPSLRDLIPRCYLYRTVLQSLHRWHFVLVRGHREGPRKLRRPPHEWTNFALCLLAFYQNQITL